LSSDVESVLELDAWVVDVDFDVLAWSAASFTWVGGAGALLVELADELELESVAASAEGSGFSSGIPVSAELSAGGALAGSAVLRGMG